MATKRTIIRPQSLGQHLNFAAGATSLMCNRMLETHDLTLPQWVILAALWQTNQTTVGDLATYSGNNIPATSRIVDRMIEKGLVRRAADKVDRRTVRISLTKKSESLRHLSNFHETVNHVLFAGMSKKDENLLLSLLQIVEKNARAQSNPILP